MKKYLLLGCTAAILMFAACKKSDEYSSAPLSDYFPLEVGKYITYQLDSTIYLNFGVTRVTRSYQVKYENDAAVTDNLGRPSSRIIRYIREDDSQPWVPDATFLATNTGTSLEFVENNMRFIKLRQPVREGYSWKGNSYIDTESQFSEFNYLDDWDYFYESVGSGGTVGNYNFENMITVNQRDEVIGNPADPEFYSEVNTSVEKYAKGIGLVYRDFYHSEYQPPTTPGGSGYHVDGSYGITLTIIDHN